MPTFTPPTQPDSVRGQMGSDDPADRLFRYYDPQEAGETVWKDPTGTWHQSVYPYHGGNSYRTFHDGILISESFDDPNESLANATQVYLGGHTYDVTDAIAAELIAAGFGDRINIGPVKIDHWEQADANKLSRFLMSSSPPAATNDPVVDSVERVQFTLSAGPVSPSNLREFWLHSDIQGTDFYASTVLDPLAYGDDVGGPGIDILPQSGIALRVQESGGIRTGITINNNIIFIVNMINIGVWRANSDGSGFTSRQAGLSLASLLPYPQGLDVELIDNIVRVRTYPAYTAPPSWDDPIYAANIDLDTEAGDAVAIPTPTGEGEAGFTVAHLGLHALSAIRFGPSEFRRI
jgi:hypothetical protein